MSRLGIQDILPSDSSIGHVRLKIEQLIIIFISFIADVMQTINQLLTGMVGEQGKDSGAEIASNTCSQIIFVLINNSKFRNELYLNEKCQKYQESI